jgi:hypothetical protein
VKEAQLKQNRVLTVILAALCLACASLPASARDPEDSAWGPGFGQRSLYVLHVPFFFFGPADTCPMERGESEWTLATAYANTFSHSWHAPKVHEDLGPPGTPFRSDEADRIHQSFPQETVWFVDGDVLRTSLEGRFGLARELSVELEIPYVSHDAFTLDGFIGSFHRAFGLGQAGRSEFPDGSFVLMFQPSNGAMTFDGRRPRAGVGDLSATLSWRPGAQWRGMRYGLDLALKAPTGSARDYNGSGSWDGGVRLFLARPGERWLFEGEAGIVFLGRWKAPVGISPSAVGRVFASAAYRLGSRSRIGASLTYEQSPFRKAGLGGVSRAGMEAALGLERDLSRRLAARATVTEHLSALGDRADIGFSVRLRYRIPAPEGGGERSGR